MLTFFLQNHVTRAACSSGTGKVVKEYGAFAPS